MSVAGKPRVDDVEISVGVGFSTRNLVIINPAAGQEDTDRIVRLFAGAFAARRAGFDVVETRGAGDAARYAREAVSAGYRSVVAVGGDGTVGEVITALAGTHIPLGIIPKGTGNQVASNLGIPRAVEDAVDVVVNGSPQPIDLGMLDDGRYFALAAGAGWDAAVIAAATRELKDRWGFAAYIYAALVVGVNPPTALYHITADGRQLEVQAAMVLVANMGRMIASPPNIGVDIGPAVSYQDGKLDVCVFSPKNAGDVAALLWKVARKSYAGDDRLLYLQAEEVRVETDPPVVYESDGEVVGNTPFVARAVPGGVTVLVPSA